jgi:hypothetical protein
MSAADAYRWLLMVGPDSPLERKLGQMIRETLTKTSLVEFADAAGVPQRRVADFANGRQSPTREELVRGAQGPSAARSGQVQVLVADLVVRPCPPGL